MFVNRDQELIALENRYNSGEAEFVILYGRRRVGKTELLKRFCEEKKHIYVLADLSSEKDQLEIFSRAVYDATKESFLRTSPFSTWDAVFEYLGGLCKDERLIVVIDEFPYLVASNPALPSIIQRFWDEKWRNTKIFLILCGSYISVMERETLGYKSPLYGRRTGQILLEPMDFQDASLFFPRYSITEKIVAYSIVGGTPAYLEQFSDRISIWQNIRERILRKDQFLYDEVRFILMEELKEPKNYFSILRAIAFGKTRLNEIVQESGLQRGMVANYLDVLQNLRIVERRIPITEEKPHKSRKGIYKLKDNFFRFYFRFIYPYKGYIEAGNTDLLLNDIIRPSMRQFLGPIFEDVCHELLIRLNREGRLPFRFDRIGFWWERNEEVDIVAYNQENRAFLFGECKWRNKPVGINILEDLKRKVEIIKKQIAVADEYYVLLSKSGFTASLKNVAHEGKLILIDIRKIG